MNEKYFPRLPYIFIYDFFLMAVLNSRRKTMSWHDNLKKQKKTGGKKRAYRTKRIYDQGRYTVESVLAETERKKVSGRSKKTKTKIVKTNYVNVSNPNTGITERLKILEVISNPANADYNRRRVITKGAVIRTEKGVAKIVSRPGQDGALNAIVQRD